jgi:hypothetical protein
LAAGGRAAAAVAILRGGIPRTYRPRGAAP